jgi:hypothetical protein
VLPKSFEGYDLTGLTLPIPRTRYIAPADGEYSFRVVLNGHRPNQSEPVHVGFWTRQQAGE